VKVPIVLFASLGDNITPPQQAFNWVADVYRSTEEIKLRGQVIVGLMHEDIGHLGIFVSARWRRRSTRRSSRCCSRSRRCRPGCTACSIDEAADDAGQPSYDVSFVELKLEDVVTR
jgi:hypothetical protein